MTEAEAKIQGFNEYWREHGELIEQGFGIDEEVARMLFEAGWWRGGAFRRNSDLQSEFNIP